MPPNYEVHPLVVFDSMRQAAVALAVGVPTAMVCNSNMGSDKCHAQPMSGWTTDRQALTYSELPGFEIVRGI